MSTGQEPSFDVSFPGPFSHHEVVVGGWSVPFLTAHPSSDERRVMLVLDDRLAETFTVAETEKVVPFLAHGIAIALGYTCHPRDGEVPNKNPQPRPMRMHGIVGEEHEEVDGESADRGQG